MAERPLPPMPMKWMCVMLISCSSFPLLRSLDINDQDKYERQDNRKIDTRFTQQLRRHIQHHLSNSLLQGRFGGPADHIFERIVCNVHVVQNTACHQITVDRTQKSTEQRILQTFARRLRSQMRNADDCLITKIHKHKKNDLPNQKEGNTVFRKPTRIWKELVNNMF